MLCVIGRLCTLQDIFIWAARANTGTNTSDFFISDGRKTAIAGRDKVWDVWRVEARLAMGLFPRSPGPQAFGHGVHNTGHRRFIPDQVWPYKSILFYLFDIIEAFPMKARTQKGTHTSKRTPSQVCKTQRYQDTFLHRSLFVKSLQNRIELVSGPVLD